MKLTYIFPGQGCQKIGMGEDFYNSSLKAREMFDEASEVLKTNMQNLLLKENDMLNETEFSQPAILLVSAIAYSLFEDKPNSEFALGHSLGEFSANYSALSLDFASAIKLVHERGLLMKKACEGKGAGMMAVIGMRYDELALLCGEFQNEGKKVWLANINNDTQIVLAGLKEDLSFIEPILKQKGAKRAIILPMSVASHCSLLSSITEPFGELLSLHVKDNFTSKIISNVTAKPYENKNEAIKLLTKQLISPVQYVKSINYVEDKSDVFVEFGASVLKGLNRKITKKPTHSIVDMKSLEETIKAVK